MAKIISIKDDCIIIGFPDGSCKTVNRSDLNFFPNVGDEVETYTYNDKLIVNKKVNKDDNNKNNIVVNVQQQQQQQQHQTIIGYQSGHPVNKIVYVLLAFFLGGLGVHRFYAGYIGSGFLRLCLSFTCVPLIISIFEAIIALLRPADSNGIIYV